MAGLADSAPVNAKFQMISPRNDAVPVGDSETPTALGAGIRLAAHFAGDITQAATRLITDSTGREEHWQDKRSKE